MVGLDHQSKQKAHSPQEFLGMKTFAKTTPSR